MYYNIRILIKQYNPVYDTIKRTMDLRRQIKDFYINHADKLPEDKRFHLATRLAAWTGDPDALALIRSLKSNFVPEPYSEDRLQAILRKLITSPPKHGINAELLRKEYFEKYPNLRGLHLALFRVRHLLQVYDIDARQVFFGLASKEECLQLERQLLADDQAVRMLSTYAINYIYLLERVMLDRDQTEAINIEHFYDLGDQYDLGDRSHVQLLIYLYTHCIIGETKFYARAIPGQLLPAYQKMLQRLESIITDHFDDINLDNKLEFLVCCRICNFDTPLKTRIDDECARSVSDNGDFLIDRHNKNQQLSRQTFASSEHRNVLFIMSGSPYPYA